MSALIFYIFDCMMQIKKTFDSTAERMQKLTFKAS